MDHPRDVPQLSCELCRSRKIKCDKLQPCTACASAGAQCVPVYRLRLPRGRHVHSAGAQHTQTSHDHQNGTLPPLSRPRFDDDLRKRIRRLEALVSKASPSSTLNDAPSETPAPSTSSKTSDNQHIHGLCDIVACSPDEAEDDTAQTSAEAAARHSHSGVRLLGLSSSPSFSNTSSSFNTILDDRDLVAQLCRVYREQVDPIVKILHHPSLSMHLIDGAAYLGYPAGHSSIQVLDSAVVYAAAASMTDEQCTARLGRDRRVLLGDCRRACETCLERASLLTTRDMTVLQAFVLYLSGRQVEEQSRAVWTLMAVAVRIAKALSLNLEDGHKGPPPTFFVQQMRRHLWLTICLMDVQAGFAMSSDPLLSVEEVQASYRLPRTVDDSEYGPHTLVPDAPADRPGLTDATYALIKYRLQLFGRQVAFAKDGSRQGLADAFTQDLMAHSFACDPAQSPFAWLVFHSAQCFAAGARVAVLRRPNGQETAGRGEGNPDLVRACAQVLEKTVLMHTDPRGAGYRWAMTVRWHGLATALAECYLCAQEASTVDRNLLADVWPTMEAAYTHHEGVIARDRGGTLRGPLGKLMAKTRQTVALLGIRVGGPHGDSVDTISTSPSTNTSTTGTQVDEWAPDSWTACWDDLLTTAALDDWSILDTQFYDAGG